jgi:hypothetical protein
MGAGVGGNKRAMTSSGKSKRQAGIVFSRAASRILPVRGMKPKEVTMPVRTEYDDGRADEIWTDLWGNLDREDGPARIEYFPNGIVAEEKYMRRGNTHREDGAAIFIYRESGKLKTSKYYRNNQLHRENGPALIDYDEDGKTIIASESYLYGGKVEEVDDHDYQAPRIDESDLDTVGF